MSRDPRLLILGGSILQMPAIRRARGMGFRIGVIDRDAKALGAAAADDFFHLSTTDIPGVESVALGYQPQGVVTMGTDMPMRALARACDRLGLPAPREESARRATDKGEMRAAFERKGVPAPGYAVLTGRSDLERIAEQFSFPVIVKPVDSSGSRGVMKVEDGLHLLRAYEYANGESRAGRVIVEEFIDGAEVSVEGICVGQEVRVLAITDKRTMGAPHFVEMGHRQPAQMSRAIVAEIENVALTAANALGLSDCGLHAEMIITPWGPRVVEVGARLGGDFIASHLVPLSTGIDLVGALIRVACGQTPDTARRWARASGISYIEEPVTALDRQRAADLAREVPGVVDVHLSARQQLRRDVRSSGDRFGHVIVVGETLDDVDAASNRALALLGIPR